MGVVEAALFVVAILYSAVGHAGASGYIAVLTFAGYSPQDARAHALLCNILVGTIAAYRFRSYFRKELFVPLVLGSIPASYAVGAVTISKDLFSTVIGILLWISAFWLLFTKRDPEQLRTAHFAPLCCSGIVIGLLAGLTGTGGGIFLSPLLLFLQLGRLKEVSAVAAPFILVNSLAGLFGLVRHHSLDFSDASWHLMAVLCGGIIGAGLGVEIKVSRHIRYLLALVLFIAGFKLIPIT